MRCNKHLALSISDAGLGELRRQLAYKSEWYSLDRDENAAINLRAYGLNELGIVPLPVDRREVTPRGEEGWRQHDRREISLVEAGSVRTPPPRPNTQRWAERPVSTVLASGYSSQRESALQNTSTTSAITSQRNTAELLVSIAARLPLMTHTRRQHITRSG
jgi:hypothetical protein